MRFRILDLLIIMTIVAACWMAVDAFIWRWEHGPGLYWKCIGKFAQAAIGTYYTIFACFWLALRAEWRRLHDHT